MGLNAMIFSGGQNGLKKLWWECRHERMCAELVKKGESCPNKGHQATPFDCLSGHPGAGGNLGGNSGQYQAVAILGRQHHALGGDAHQFGGFEVGDDNDPSTR